jgi:hypothetical protein
VLAFARTHMRGRCTLLALVTSCTLLAACSDDEPSPSVSPSSAFPATGVTGATGETGGSGATGILPTTSPARGTGTLSEGEVTFSVTGDAQADRVLSTLISAVYTPPPGGIVLVWTAGGTDASTLGIGGSSFVGSRATAPSLSLTLTVQTEGTISTFTSSAGECTITIDVADEERIGGSFACIDLSGGDGETVDAIGSFSAHG